MTTSTIRAKAYFLLVLIMTNTLAPLTSVFALSGGPSQPEVQGFEPAGTSQMVDLTSGSFTYNIPLCEVGGYPLNLSYHSGVTMDQEASCVGLGWSLNPGVINRNMRGLPDDFKRDEVKKEFNVAPNNTYGVNGTLDLELLGAQLGKKKPKKGDPPTPPVSSPPAAGTKKGFKPDITLSAQMGVTYNNYKGVGFEFGLNAGLSFPTKGGNKMNLGLGLNAGTFGGVSVTPNVNYDFTVKGKGTNNETTTTPVGIGAGIGFNSRRGLTSLSLSGNAGKPIFQKNKNSFGTEFSFANPSYTPSFSLPYTNSGFTGKFKAGGQIFVGSIGGTLTGYYTQNKLAYNSMSLQSFGYLYAQDGAKLSKGLMDFNRELDGAFNENKPNLPIVVPTQDVYSVSGQGIGGSYQLKRSDVGVMYDSRVSSYSVPAASVTIEATFGNAGHGGGGISLNATDQTSGKWENDNPALRYLNFVDSSDVNDPGYETAYFKSSGEKSVESDPSFVSSIGGDKAAAVGLLHFGANTTTDRAFITKEGARIPMNNSVRRKAREKRNQSISWLNAQEASDFALDKKIKTYTLNTFDGVSESLERVGDYKKKHHISEITTLREDGVRYVYGIPAYNIEQREVTFGVDNTKADCSTGLVGYTAGLDNSSNNQQGPENYFNRVTTPGYAHSYLLTSVVSPDYIDIDGNGCTKNDIGTYTKFNYNRLSNNYQWRVPTQKDKANHSEGFKTEKNDDKGNYVYGKKEIWYVHSVESKNEEARFYYKDRNDGYGVASENGGIASDMVNMRLDRIEIYTKASIGNVLSEPIKKIFFEYDYALCKNSPNSNAATTAGKLTLRKVYFTYGNSQKGKLSPYKFVYAGDNPQKGINPDYNLKSYDRWSFYKPSETDCNKVANGDFPYSIQDSVTAAKYASAWNMTSVQLPSGGEINVTYESNDYAYVQDKRALQMIPISWLVDNITGDVLPSNIGNTLYTDNNRKSNPYLIFKLPKRLKGNADALKEVIKNMYLNGSPEDFYIYFKCLVALGGTTKSEYVPGYYKAASNSWGVLKSNTSTDGYDYGYLKLRDAQINDDGSGDVINPITKAALNFTRMHLPKLAYGEPDINMSVGKQALTALASVGKQMKQLFTGFNKDMMNRGYSKTITLEKSWIRLTNPEYKKYGGGCRVKRIDMSDEWSTMAGQPNDKFSYGQEYTYTKEETLPTGEKKIISSGVTSYEPMIGGDENPFKQPIFIKESNILAPDDDYFIEGPIGESMFPGPAVVYSEVKVRNLQYANVSKNATGWTVSEYYTAKDFPTIVKQTALVPDVSRVRKNNRSSAIMSFLKTRSVDKMTASQGYVVELNDMHGKPKAQWNYDERGTRLSGVEYKYKTDSDNPNHLNNDAKVIRPNGTIETAQIGVDYTILADGREAETLTRNMGLSANFDAFFAFLFFTLPSIYPGLSSEQTTFRSMVVTKVINRSALIEKVIAHEHGANIATENVAYDSETGDVLMTKSQNEYNDDHYNFTFPAHWAYEGMQAAYKNVGAVVKGSMSNSSDGNISIPTSGMPYFTFGDEIACRKATGVDVKGWVINVNKSNNSIQVVDAVGVPLSSGTYTRIKVLRSGHRNLQATPIAAVKTKKPIISGNNLKFEDVLEASATEFSDKWQTGAEIAYYDGYYKTPSSTNPYTLGSEGNWRPQRSWSYLEDRKSQPANSANSTSIRFDGTFNSFSPFWKIPLNTEGYWSKNETNWTWSKMNTKIDGHGNQLESVDALGRFDARLMGYNNTLVTAIADNAKYSEISFDSYEEVFQSTLETVLSYNFLRSDVENIPNLSAGRTFNWKYKNEVYEKTVYSLQDCIDYMNQIDPKGNWKFYEGTRRFRGGVGISELALGKTLDFEPYNEDRTGYKSVGDYGVLNLFTAYSEHRGESDIQFAREYRPTPVDKPNSVGPVIADLDAKNGLRLTNKIAHSGTHSIKLDGLEAEGNLFHTNLNAKKEERGGFNLKKGRHILSAWVHIDDAASATTFKEKAYISVIINDKTYGFTPSGNILDGWQRIYGEFDVPENITYAKLRFGGVKVYFDDLRIHPFNANMKSFVYDPVTLRLVSELDENNYPTYYEYDKAGNLSHVKKVTEKGVQTVKEVRAGTIKNPKVAAQAVQGLNNGSGGN
jgi:hypothetical protein